MLKHLPHTIGNMTSLKLLDVSYNSLLYLPYEIFKLSTLECLSILTNPCITDQVDIKVNQMDPPKLDELSSAILQQKRFVVSTNVLCVSVYECRIFFLHSYFFFTKFFA